MSTLRVTGRIIAASIILMLAVVVPIFLLAYNAQAVATSEAFLASIVGEDRLFEEALSEAAEDLARDVPQDPELRASPIARLNADDWERILRTIAPARSLRRWAQDALEAFRDWSWHGGIFLESLTLPFGEVQDNLVSDPDQAVMRTVVEAQPACASGQEPLGGPNDLIPTCRPATPDLEPFYQALSSRWQEDPRDVWEQLWPGSRMPYAEDISLAELIRRESGQRWPEIRVGWRLAAWALILARGLLLMLIIGPSIIALLVIALLAARNMPEALRWAGAPALLVGVTTLALGVMVLTTGWMGPHWQIYYSDLSVGIRAALDDIARTYATGLFSAMAWQGSLLAVIGLSLFTVSFVVPKPSPRG